MITPNVPCVRTHPPNRGISAVKQVVRWACWGACSRGMCAQARQWASWYACSRLSRSLWRALSLSSFSLCVCACLCLSACARQSAPMREGTPGCATKPRWCVCWGSFASASTKCSACSHSSKKGCWCRVLGAGMCWYVLVCAGMWCWCWVMSVVRKPHCWRVAA